MNYFFFQKMEKLHLAVLLKQKLCSKYLMKTILQRAYFHELLMINSENKSVLKELFAIHSLQLEDHLMIYSLISKKKSLIPLFIECGFDFSLDNFQVVFITYLLNRELFNYLDNFIGFQKNEEFAEEVIKRNNVSVLEFLHEKKFSFNSGCVMLALKYKSLDALKFLNSKNCLLHPSAFGVYVGKYGTPKIFEYFCEYLNSIGYDLYEEYFTSCYSNDNIELFEHLLETKKIHLSADIFKIAFVSGSLRIQEYFYKRNFVVEITSDFLKKKDCIKSLEFLESTGFKFQSDHLNKAVSCGHLNTVKFLLKRVKPTTKTPIYASCSRFTKVLKFFLEMKMEISFEMLKKAAKKNKIANFQILYAKYTCSNEELVILKNLAKNKTKILSLLN